VLLIPWEVRRSFMTPRLVIIPSHARTARNIP
jgi:hypothetical protein